MGDKRKLIAVIISAVIAYIQMKLPPQVAPKEGSK
jgi:hypothetical protein